MSIALPAGSPRKPLRAVPETEFWESLGLSRIHDKNQEGQESHKEMLKMKEPPGMCMKTKA
jgi:hypothetical protein